MKIWQPWIEETKSAINRYARWVFAALVLNFLLFANIAVILFTVLTLRQILS